MAEGLSERRQDPLDDPKPVDVIFVAARLRPAARLVAGLCQHFHSWLPSDYREDLLQEAALLLWQVLPALERIPPGQWAFYADAAVRRRLCRLVAREGRRQAPLRPCAELGEPDGEQAAAAGEPAAVVAPPPLPADELLDWIEHPRLAGALTQMPVEEYLLLNL